MRSGCQLVLQGNTPGYPYTISPRALCSVYCAYFHKHDLNVLLLSVRALRARTAGTCMHVPCLCLRVRCVCAFAMLVAYC